MKKYSNLSEEILSEAYNILYHANDRPAYVKAKQVREILAGEVTPCSQAATWQEFFDFLDAKLAPAPPGPISPAEWLENQGVDTQQIVSYYVKDGVGDGTFIDVEEVLAGYAAHVAEYTAPKDLPDHCQDPCSGFAGGCVMEGHCKECEQTKKNPPMNKNEKPPAPMTPAEWAKRARPEVTFSSEALTGMQDYAEYVAEYMRCRFSEAMDEEVKKYYMSRHAQKRIIEKATNQ